jgi:general secretion pathway protein H
MNARERSAGMNARERSAGMNARERSTGASAGERSAATDASARNGGGSGGHTLLELLTVVAVVAVAAALAAPALVGVRTGQQLEAAAFGLTQTLRLAHWRAVATGERARVVSRQEADGAWRFAIEREQGGGWAPAGVEQAIPRGTIVAIAGPAEKVFNPDGTCSLGSVTLRGAGGASYRCTLTAATGRVRFYRGEREVGRGL